MGNHRARRAFGLEYRGTTLKDLAKSGDLATELAAAFEASPNAYLLLDPELRIAGANRAYLDLTRQSREALLGRHVLEAFDAGGNTANAERLRASFESVLLTGKADHIAVIHYAIPLPDETGGTTHVDRYWSATHSPVTDVDGKLKFILQNTTDITELETLRSQAGLRTDMPRSALDTIVSERILQRAESIQQDRIRIEHERNRLLELFMQAPGFMAVLTGPDHVIEMHNTAYGQMTGRDNLIGLPIREARPDLTGQGHFELLDAVFASGKPYEGRRRKVRVQRSPDVKPQTIFLDFIYQPICGSDGAVIGIFIQGHDVTDAVMADDRQRLMIDELNHRVKNTLATVQSIAIQTSRSHPDPSGFAEAFQSRLMALSHTHDLLTRRHWAGADLKAILEHETEAHGSHRISLNGPPVELDPPAALSLGMIFHELATNAAKYGALSATEGRVLIDWCLVDDAHPRLNVGWREVGGPVIGPPARKGFGSRLVERNVRHDLAGNLSTAYPADGFKAEISIPLNKAGTE
ncbi:PAS domain-containing protein [Rhizobium sp. CRIBSB]|nr:PAS domain-containing protein [Rhizobium sp. CRIBSB]